MQTGIADHDTEQKQGNAMNNNPNHCGSHKEKKIAITKTTVVAVLITLGLVLTTTPAAEPLPYGHSDPVPEQARYGAEGFVPTPERPVYFRQTYGYYPGATPPLEWWEGTPTLVGGEITDNSGNVHKTRLRSFADQKSKNILWKAPVPGWSLSHPIVVGKKVFAVGEPDFVTCWDLDTGKQLWQRRIMPLLCDGLSEDKAAAGQKVLDLARALWLVSGRGSTSGAQEGNFYRYGPNSDRPPFDMTEEVVAKRTAFVDKVLRMAQKHRPDVEAFGDADLLKAVDEDIAILQSWANAQQDADAMLALIKGAKRSNRLVTACARKFGISFGGAWWGFCGTADATLASDGQRIYGVFAQGQVFALDLDGKTVWLQREKSTRVGGNYNPFNHAPLLFGDPAGGGAGLLLVRSLALGKTQPLRAFDTATGKLCWETPLPLSCYAVPCLMRLPGADGKPVDVLVGNGPENPKGVTPVLRVTDGKILGHLPPQRIARGQMMAVFGQQVTWVEDTGPACSYRLRLDDAGAVVAEEVFAMKGFRSCNFPTVAGTTMLNNNRLVDATTGTVISTLPGRVGDIGVVAGHHLITLATQGGWHGDNNNDAQSRRRDDRMIFGSFTVIDIKDPAKPVVVAKNNLLGHKEPAADFIVSTYFKDFDPYDFAGCYKGSASYFMMMSGPVPHGDKLLIQSSSFLYCIGEK